MRLAAANKPSKEQCAQTAAPKRDLGDAMTCRLAHRRDDLTRHVSTLKCHRCLTGRCRGGPELTKSQDFPPLMLVLKLVSAQRYRGPLVRTNGGLRGARAWQATKVYWAITAVVPVTTVRLKQVPDIDVSRGLLERPS